MDEFIDQFFSSSSWTDDKASERSSWVENELDQTNGLLADTMGVYEEDQRNLPASLISSSHIVDSLITDGTSMFVGEDSSFDFGKSSLSGESQQGADQGSKLSLLGFIDGNLKPGYRDQELNPPSSLGTLYYGSPELLPVFIDPAKSPSVQPESVSVGSNDSEPSEIQPTPIDSHSLTSVPHFWHPSFYRGVSSVPPVMGQDNVQGLGLQGQYVESDAAVLGNKNFMGDSILQANLPALLSVNGQDELNNHYLSSFAAAHQIQLGRTAEIHPQMQLNEANSMKHYTDQCPISQLAHTSATDVGGCNGAIKPRVRARRGQATDPHSIAERLRREKIAERMKNLQELIPNSNKMDKSSMLDEIIEYVKFLQLQVKVLSMSRLGAAGAVVPLITDIQTEGSTGLLLSHSAGRAVDPFESPNLAFEQEVVKLMESNMTTAIQFLQSKGLCLMPTALATAISSCKASSDSISAEEKKLMISSDGETWPKKNIVGIHSKEDIPSNGCDGNGIKQEEVMNTANGTTEMNPET